IAYAAFNTRIFVNALVVNNVVILRIESPSLRSPLHCVLNLCAEIGIDIVGVHDTVGVNGTNIDASRIIAVASQPVVVEGSAVDSRSQSGSIFRAVIVHTVPAIAASDKLIHSLFSGLNIQIGVGFLIIFNQVFSLIDKPLIRVGSAEIILGGRFEQGNEQ